jgi:DNA-binding NtrC family response regulator
MNILIVEDDMEFASSIQESIHFWNHNAEISVTGEEALQKLRNKQFELTLLDIYLPDCKGNKIIPTIKEIQHDMGIVTMTGYNTRALELEIRKLGIGYYLIKPFHLNELKEIINHISNKNKEKVSI